MVWREFQKQRETSPLHAKFQKDFTPPLSVECFILSKQVITDKNRLGSKVPGFLKRFGSGFSSPNQASVRLGKARKLGQLANKCVTPEKSVNFDAIFLK